MAQRVAVALSGGVDSAVSALLLQRAGYEVSGAFMRNWDETDEHCTVREDFFDALSVADKLGIELTTLDFSREYREQVFADFLRDHQQGLTPNPDILCNREIKFNCFFNQVLEQTEADWIATGHYARIKDGQLCLAEDTGKDQTYFLYQVPLNRLTRTLFPLGDLCKPQVRQIARENDLQVAEKKDSTGLCFVGERNFRQFLGRFLPEAPGPICTSEGRIIGEHAGLHYYTLGQRRGLDIGGGIGDSGEPWYVANKLAENNTLVVVQGDQHSLLYSESLEADDLHWLCETDGDFTAQARIRHRQNLQPCRVSLGQKCMQVQFEQPQWAATPGQSVVLYRDGVCLGGGIIRSTQRMQSGLPMVVAQ